MTDEDIMTALAQRWDKDACASDAEAAAWVAGEQGEIEPTGLDRDALVLLAKESAELEALWPDESPAPVLPIVPVVPVVSVGAPPARRGPSPMALGVVVALAAGLLLMLLPRPESAVAPQPPDAVRTMGAPPSDLVWDLHVGVKRADEEFMLGSGGTLRAGDQIGLFYSAPGVGYLAVFYADTSSVVALFPGDASTAQRVVAGNRMRLDAGATLTAGEGCEWVIGAYSVAPFDLEALEQDIRQRMAKRHGCTLADPGLPYVRYRSLEIWRGSP